MTFLRRVLEKADLRVVEADQRVEVARPGDLLGPAFVGLFIRQQNLGRAGFQKHVENIGAHRVRQALGGEHDGAVCFPQHFQPFADLLPEDGMAEHNPGFVKKQERGRAGQRALEVAEKVEQRRDQVLLAKRHQLFDLEHCKRAVADAVVACVEEVSERTLDRVGAERRAEFES